MYVGTILLVLRPMSVKCMLSHWWVGSYQLVREEEVNTCLCYCLYYCLLLLFVVEDVILYKTEVNKELNQVYLYLKNSPLVRIK